MHSKINSVSLEYGDANITFFLVQFCELYGHTASPNDHVIWTNHSYYEIYICQKGMLTCNVADQKITLQPGELLIIPPNTRHKPLTVEAWLNTTVASIAVTPTENNNKFYNVLINALNGSALKPLQIPGVLNTELQLLGQDGLYQSLLGICKLKAVAAEFVYLLFSKIISNDTVPVYSKSEMYVLLKELVNVKGITMDDIAAATHYSKRHVARLIKKQYGMSLTKLQQQNQKEQFREREDS